MRMCSCRGTAGFAHVSCLAEEAKILVAEAEENNLGLEAMNERWLRWSDCSLCEQKYHGDVKCALGWACWKAYVGRPEANQIRGLAMNLLGNGLHEAERHADALTVREAELATQRRVGETERNMLVAQSNLASTYQALGRLDEALSLRQEGYFGRLELSGEEHEHTIHAASNYAHGLITLQRYAEAKSLLRKMIPVARRILGETHEITLTMRKIYARALYVDDGATLDDLREAVATLEDTDRTGQRVLGRAHPLVGSIENLLRDARAVLRTAQHLTNL